MFDYPRIPYDLHHAEARRLRAEAQRAFFARLVAFFRDKDGCPDCGKPIVIS